MTITVRSLRNGHVGNCMLSIPTSNRAVSIPVAKVHPLNDIRLKIERANKHIKDINIIITDWVNSNGISIKRKSDGTKQFVKFYIKPIEKMLPIMIGEVFFQLKSALDLLMCALAELNGRGTSGVKFPICADLKEFESERGQGPIEKLSLAARNHIFDLKPYKGGNNLLWAMNTLRNKDGHIRLLPLITRFPLPSQSGRFEDTTNNDFGIDTPLVVEIGNLIVTSKNEITLATCSFAGDIKIENDTKPIINIAFSDIEGIEREPIVALLQQFLDLTTSIVDIFDSAFFSNHDDAQYKKNNKGKKLSL